jgi:SAM-dependent methyltransferase
MPDLLRFSNSLSRRAFGFAFHLFDLVAYEVLYRLSPARKHWFFNGGYLPVDDDFLAIPEFRAETHCAMMYHQAGHSQIKELAPTPRQIIDIGCGQGGGLVYLSRLYPGAGLTGTERSRSAVALARQRTAGLIEADIRSGSAALAGFAPASFDLVISVGAPTYFGLTRFVSEVARLVSPGGVISFSGGYRQGDHTLIEAELRQAAAAEGLEFISYRDITPHTFASLKADLPRREVEIAKVPWPFRIYAVKWADMPGSREFLEYETGQRADFAAVLRKPAGARDSRA